jgi:hypothetical protein
MGLALLAKPVDADTLLVLLTATCSTATVTHIRRANAAQCGRAPPSLPGDPLPSDPRPSDDDDALLHTLCGIAHC